MAKTTKKVQAPEEQTDVEAKKKALEVAITQIEKECGKGSIMRLG